MTTTSSRWSRRMSAQAAAGPPPGRRRRNLPLAMSGVLLVAGCATAFAVMSVNAGDRRPVVVVRHDVAAGTVLAPDDVGTVRAAVPGSLHLIGAADLEAVTGRTTSVPLSARTLLTWDMLTQRAFPPAGQAIVGVALKPGQAPPTLVPGSRVQAYQVAGDQPDQPATGQPTTAAGGGEPALPITAATVLRVRSAADGGGTVVEMQLPKDDVPQVAAAAAAGRVTLALVAGR